MTTTDTDWIVRGASVVAYTVGGAGTEPGVCTTVIKSVAGKSFRLEASGEPRYDLVSQSYRLPGTWAGTRYVVPRESATGQAMLDGARKRTAIQRADRAYKAWRDHRTTEGRDALIAALRDIPT